MIKTAVIVVLFVAAIVAFAMRRRVEAEFESPAAAKTVPAVLATAALILTAWSCTVLVRATETGVPVTFGRVGTPLQAGWHTKLPWTKVESLPVRPFAVPDLQVTARTNQGGQAKVVTGARWQVIPEQAGETYLQVRTGDEGKITEQVVDKSLATAIGNVMVKRDNIAATTDRVGVESDALAEVNRLTAPFGVKVTNVFIRAVEPDEKTADAIARVAAQERETQIAVEAQKTAAEQAKQRLIEAEGLRDAANRIPALTAEQAQALCLQAWERMAAKAIAASVPLYTSPCGGASSLPVSVPAK